MTSRPEWPWNPFREHMVPTVPAADYTAMMMRLEAHNRRLFGWLVYATIQTVGLVVALVVVAVAR